MPAVFIGSAACDLKGAAVAIGNFDGVHAGHRAVIARLRSFGLPVCVYTFDPAPTAVVAPERHQPRITTLAERVRLLGEAGVDVVIIEPFTRAWAAHPARWFAEVVLERRLRAKALVVGWDFRFGHGREGNAASLRAWLPGMTIAELDVVQAGERAVSSSRVRTLVKEGKVKEAAALLGRPHALTGTIVTGDKRGRTIGFPTANLENEVELLPAHGVYAVRARIDDGPALLGVANIGVRPTVDGRKLSIEVHLLDFDRDVYGCEMRVELIARVREERRFEGIDALATQIRVDVATARDLLA